MDFSNRSRLVAWLMVLFVAVANGLAISYCSPDNTGSDFSAVYNQFQSNGACQQTCQSSYAYAILQGSECWCSNYGPATQENTLYCNETCPGFESEWCGSTSSGLYGYYALTISPSGIAGGASSTSASSSAQAQSTTFVTSSSPSPTPTPLSTTPTVEPSTSSPSPSTSPSTTPSITPPVVATEAITHVTTVTGQVQTIVVTPSATADPNVNQGPVSNGGISKGKVAGIAIGCALGIGIIIGLMVFFYFKRKHGRASGSAASFAGPFERDAALDPSRHLPSRQVSQISSAGLLATKGPRISTQGHGVSSGPRSADTASAFSTDRRSVGTDQRLNPYALYAHDESRHSNISLQDNQDYSRQLRVANPDP